MLTYTVEEAEATIRGKWSSAKNYFPSIAVDQKKRHVTITKWEHGYGDTNVSTESCEVEISDDGTQMLIRGEVWCKNWVNWEGTGFQNFCFAVFVGDSGHIYTHRAPATKGWMNASANDVRKRLRKLGIGAEKPAYQQGDFLLKKANGNAYPDAKFLHETLGSGHHKFASPVLYCDTHNGKRGRQYKINEPTLLYHEATDGIQHPDVLVEPGIYIVGTTANSLRHRNRRD